MSFNHGSGKCISFFSKAQQSVSVCGQMTQKTHRNQKPVWYIDLGQSSGFAQHLGNFFLTAATLPAEDHLLQHLLREQRHHVRAAITVPKPVEGLAGQHDENTNTRLGGDAMVGTRSKRRIYTARIRPCHLAVVGYATEGDIETVLDGA